MGYRLPVKDSIILGVLPYYRNDHHDALDWTQYYSYGSFTNLDDPKIECRWNHDKNMPLGSVGDGYLRIFEWNGALNIVLKPAGTAISDWAFEEVRNLPYCGISPLSVDFLKDQKKDFEGIVGRQKCKLREISLTVSPVNRGSIAVVRDQIDWERFKRDRAEFWNMLQESKSRPKYAKSDPWTDQGQIGRKLTEEQINAIKARSPVFGNYGAHYGPDFERR